MSWLADAAQEAERIFRAARDVARDDDAAWDSVQEAFATALGRAAPPDDPVPWLCAVARNHARHHVRARSRWAAALERFAARRPTRAPGPPADLQDALAGLPMKLRDAVTLRYLAGMSFAEVARAQGTTETAAKARVQRGLSALRRMLGGLVLASLLAREASAAQGKAALKGAVALAAAGGAVMKKWVIVALALACLLGTAAVYRATREGRARERVARVATGTATPEEARAEPATTAPPPPIVSAYPAERAPAPLRGQVVDHARRPAAEVAVRVVASRGAMVPELAVADDRAVERTVTTDAGGRFALELPAGPYRVVAAAADGRRAEALTATDTPLLLVLPEAARRRKLVVIVRDEAGAPVADAAVDVVLGEAGTGVRSLAGRTGEDGTCAFEDVEAGDVVARAHAPGGATGWAARRPMPFERSETVVVTVAPNGSLGGRVFGVDAGLLQGSRVLAHALTVNAPYWSAIGFAVEAPVIDARYRFDALPAGEYALTLDAPGGARLVTELMRFGDPLENSAEPRLAKVAPGATATCDLQAAPAAAVEGSVAREDGSAVEGALVRVTFAPRNGNFPDGFVLHGCNVWRLDADLEAGSDHPSTHWRVRTDRAGRYRLASLPPGRMRVEVFADGLSFDRREDVAVEAGAATRLEHRLVAAGVLQVAVHDASYFGLVPAGSERPLLIAIVSGRAAFTLPGLPPGRYRGAAFHSDESIGVIAEYGETEIVAGRTTWWDLRGTGRYVVRGHVVDPGGPVAGLRMRMYGAGVAVTDGQGAFEFRSAFIPAVSRRARPGATIDIETNEGPVRRRFSFPAGGEESNCEIVLGGYALAIRTEDDAGAPAPATVELVAEEGDPDLQPASFRCEGSLAVGHLREATYRITAMFPGGANVTARARVPEAREVLLREPPCGRVEIEVLGGSDLKVWVGASRAGTAKEDPAAWLGNAQVALDGSGKAVLPRFPAGEIEVRLQRSGWFGPEVRFRAGGGVAGTTATTTLEPKKTLRLELTVEPASR